MAIRTLTFSAIILLCVSLSHVTAQTPSVIEPGKYLVFPPVDQKRMVITFDQFKNTIKTGQKHDSLVLINSKLNQTLLLSDKVIDSLELSNNELKTINNNLNNSLQNSSTDLSDIKIQLRQANSNNKKFAGLGLIVGLAAGILIF